MTVFSIKVLLTGVWCSAFLAAGVLGDPILRSAWLTLVVLAVGPPLLLMHFWTQPATSTSEDIQKALR